MNMDIHNERREYLQSGLRREELNSDPIKQFEHWLGQAKDAKITDPTAMILSTVDADARPSQRTVLLKQFDHQGFVFFTNLESKKSQQIQHNQNVCILFPWLSMERQVIISGKAEAVSTKECLNYFLSRPRDSQLAAWVSQQSNPISSKELLINKFHEITERFANKDISLPKFWGGYRIVPDRIEFWAGGAKRLHDRFEFQKQADGEWHIERLQP